MTKEIYDKATELLNNMAYYADEILKYKRKKFLGDCIDESAIELLAKNDEEKEKYLRLFEEAYEEKQKEFEAL